MLDDPESAPIPDRLTTLFSLVEKANRETSGATCPTVDRADVERARDAGWSQQAIYDALTVCALFNFYNCWVDAAGVKEMSEEEYAASARRLATEGYVVGAEP